MANLHFCELPLAVSSEICRLVPIQTALTMTTCYCSHLYPCMAKAASTPPSRHPFYWCLARYRNGAAKWVSAASGTAQGTKCRVEWSFSPPLVKIPSCTLLAVHDTQCNQIGVSILHRGRYFKNGIPRFCPTSHF